MKIVHLKMLKAKSNFFNFSKEMNKINFKKIRIIFFKYVISTYKKLYFIIILNHVYENLSNE